MNKYIFGAILILIFYGEVYGQNRSTNDKIESIAVSELSINSIPQSLGEEILDILLTKLKQKTSQVITLTSTMVKNHTNCNFTLSPAFISEREIQKIGQAYNVTHVLTGVAVKLNDAVVVSIKIVDCNQKLSKHASINCYNTSKKELQKYLDILIEKLNVKFIH